MKKFALLIGAFAAVLTLSLSSCSKSVSRDDVVAKFKQSGANDQLANCMADGMIAKFSPEKIASSDAPSAEETAALQQIVTECASKDGASVTTAP